MSVAWQGPALMTLAVVLVFAGWCFTGAAGIGVARSRPHAPLSAFIGAALLFSALAASFWASRLWGAS